MKRDSRGREIDAITGRLLNGFDYQRQAWVKDGRFMDCGHVPKHTTCYGARHAGEETTGSGVCTTCGDALDHDLSGKFCLRCSK